MIYLASKTKHASKWRELRAIGYPIVSSWIDEAGVGETKCFVDLWTRCVREASQSSALIVYVEDDDVLKGALVEVGAALGANVPVIVVGNSPSVSSWAQHPLIRRADSVAHALDMVAEHRPTELREATQP